MDAIGFTYAHYFCRAESIRFRFSVRLTAKTEADELPVTASAGWQPFRMPSEQMCD